MKSLFTAFSLFGLIAGYPAGSDAHFMSREAGGLKSVQTSNASTPKAKVAKATVQLSAQELARMLEQQVLSGEGVSMKFKIKDGENVSVVADVKSKKVRIETASMTIISDGQTVYNYQKRNNQLTIDALGKGRASALSNPKDLFLFATNYSATLVSSNAKDYVLALTPNARVQSTLQAAGGISTITFNLNVANQKLNIKSAMAASNGKNVETGALSVKSLKTLPANQFVFNTPKGARVIDLRD
jgi:outer membrane lipoprotein-sorting protein